jgi:hypothetical protein
MKQNAKSDKPFILNSHVLERVKGKWSLRRMVKIRLSAQRMFIYFTLAK